jgi:hypothetical protein
MAESVLLRGPVSVANLTAAAGVTTTEDGWWPCLDLTWRTPVPASITKITAQVRERGADGRYSQPAETVMTADDLFTGTAKIVNGVSVGQHLEVRLFPAGAPGLPFQATPWVEVTTSWDALIAALGGLNLGCGATVCGDEVEFVQAKPANASYAVTLDGAPTLGNWLIAFGFHNSALPAANTGWTSFATHNQTVQGPYVRLVYKQAGGSETASQTPFSGSAGSRGGVTVVELTGLLGGFPALLQAVTFAEAPATGNATATVSDDTTADNTFALAFSGWQDAANQIFTLALDSEWQGPNASSPNTDQRAQVSGYREITGSGETVTATTTTGVAHYGLTAALLLITSPKSRRIGALSIRDEGTEVEDVPSAINFTGAGLVATADGAGGVTVTLNSDTDPAFTADSDDVIPTQAAVKAYVDANVGAAIEVQDEGVTETSALVSLNFTGAGVTATDDGFGNVAVNVPGGGTSFSGCMVHKSANLTGQNFVTATRITWDTEDYDTGGWHESVTNPGRLTVPSGVTMVDINAFVRNDNVTANSFSAIFIYKNGSFIRMVNTSTSNLERWLNITLQGYPVTAGDYFEIFIQTQSDTSTDILAGQSSFAIRAVG